MCETNSEKIYFSVMSQVWEKSYLQREKLRKNQLMHILWSITNNVAWAMLDVTVLPFIYIICDAFRSREMASTHRLAATTRTMEATVYTLHCLGTPFKLGSLGCERAFRAVVTPLHIAQKQCILQNNVYNNTKIVWFRWMH